MNKRTALILLGIALCILVICALITRCSLPNQNDDVTKTDPILPGNLTLSESDVEGIVVSYNDKAKEFNLAVRSYNESVQQLVEANAALEQTILSAQEQIDTKQIPFDSITQENLESAIANAKNAMQPVPELLNEVEMISLPENADADELEDFCITTEAKYDELIASECPTPISIPDYSPYSNAIVSATEAYITSIRMMQQVTAPTDNFVLERLKDIDTILSLAAVTSKNDPNRLLSQKGGYIGCIYFSDSRVDKTQLNLDPDEYDVISMGTVGGGAIEIFATVEEANARNEYLSQYDNTSMDPGSHVVIGTIVIRTSSKLSDADQATLEAEIIEALTWLDSVGE